MSSLPLSSPAPIDGDTLKCGRQRYRLMGMDAPEMAGHCRKGWACALGDPIASRDSLVRLIEGREVEMNVFGIERYQRPLAWRRLAELICLALIFGQEMRPMSEVGY
jgi:hypothetical protein